MGERRRIILLIGLLWLLVEPGWAGEPGRFAISQVSARPPVVTVYLDVLDENGEPPARLAASDLSAVIQQQPLPVTQVASFDASGEGVAYIFLVDISKSISPTQFAQIRQAIDDWIDGLKSADQMAIFTFGTQYKQLVGFTNDTAKLKGALQGLEPTDMQTKLYLALNNAMSLGRQDTTGLPSRRVIVILSDGKDEGSAITADDVRDLIWQSRVPIYAIGYSRLPVQEREKYLDVLSRFATLSGGIYSGADSLKTAYAEMQQTIRRLFVVRLNCKGCREDGQSHPLKITLTSGKVSRSSLTLANVIPTASPAAAGNSWWKPTLQWVLKWKIVLSLILVICIGFVVVFYIEIAHQPPLPTKPVVVPTGIVDPTKPVAKPVSPLISSPIPTGRRIQLTVISGKEHGRVDYINLVNKSVIGRDRECAVSYPEDAEMSGKHCELSAAGQQIEVVDLKSTNGTLLNGAALVTKQRIQDGDLLRAGRTEFRVNFGGAT